MLIPIFFFSCKGNHIFSPTQYFLIGISHFIFQFIIIYINNMHTLYIRASSPKLLNNEIFKFSTS